MTASPSPTNPDQQADPPAEFQLQEVAIRTAQQSDLAFLQELFQESVIEGLVGDNDTGADIENLREGYFEDGGQSCFWVAVHQDLVIAMIGVQKMADNAAEVRRLRVRKAYRRLGLGTMLMEKALSFCQRQGYLKVVLDVRIERGPAIALFQKFGFTHARTRDIGGRKLLDFYIDLYRDPRH